jgi:hypothetical protein
MVVGGIAVVMLLWLGSFAAVDSLTGPLSQLFALLAGVVERVVEMTGGIFNWL